ncbi:mitochondrial import receptor subunit TOM70-like [Stylophora pistillata]|uniref:Mitochondrial import receptor subunit TOM70 n=1 Tax=Stylophora pistillata TaxID=50429 RepID=A0A2B4SYH2_STYPI|nr:mitochondrial import receptor subunit TOM70-like [Stylophora pistillata]PFX33618.1 Mitochondrial import receptor subunit TOM70 [Stylophora pistillata]
MSTQETGGGLSKWQIAALIGAPVAAACILGAFYYWRSSRSSEQKDAEKGEGDTSTGASDVPRNEAPEGEENMSPAERAQAIKLRGNKYFKGGKFEQAIKSYTEAIDLCPRENNAELATYYQNRAAAYEQQKNYEQVLADATKAVELNKKYSKAFMKRARAYEKLDRKEECLQDLTAVCMIEGFNNPNWMMQADRVLKEIGKEKAQEYYKNRELSLPSPTYTKAYLESFCNDDTLVVDSEEDLAEDSPFLEAVKQMKEKKFDNIVNLCTQQIEKGTGPLYIKALALRGTLYTLISKVDEAVHDLTQVINADDNNVSTKLKVNCLIKRGSMQLQASNVMECYQDFTKAVSLDPDNSDIYHHRGQIYFLSEKLVEAKEDFEKCISLNDSFIPAKIQLAYCIYKSAALQQSPILAHGALDMLQKTVETYPESADAHSLYAQVLQDMQQFAKAEEHFDTAIKLEPQNPVHRVYKGMLMLQSRQDVEKAVELVTEALEIDQKCDFAYETLATLEVQRGNLDRAIDLFNKAISLVRTETELAQTFSLREAAKAQKYVTETLGLTPPTLPFMS